MDKMLDSFVGSEILKCYNPMNLFKKFRGRGVSDSRLEELIYDAAVDAYIRCISLNSKENIEKGCFGPYINMYCFGAISREIEKNSKGKCSKKESELLYRSDDGFVSPFDNLIDGYEARRQEIDNATVFCDDSISALIDDRFYDKLEELAWSAFLSPEQKVKAMNLETPIDLSRWYRIFVYRYCQGRHWGEIKKLIGVSCSAFDKRIRQWFADYIISDDGESVLKRLYGDNYQEMWCLAWASDI